MTSQNDYKIIQSIQLLKSALTIICNTVLWDSTKHEAIESIKRAIDILERENEHE